MARVRGSALIADGQSLNRAGLATMLKEHVGFTRVIVESDLEAAGKMLATQPSIGFAALGIELIDAADFMPLRQLRLSRLDLNIAILSSSLDRELIFDALGAGVNGYILRSSAEADIIEALRVVADGKIYVPPLVSDIQQRARANAPAGDAVTAALTDRQRQVLELLVSGKSNKEIGRALRIAEGTVKVHVSSIFRLLGVKTRGGAAAMHRQLIVQSNQLRRSEDLNRDALFKEPTLPFPNMSRK